MSGAIAIDFGTTRTKLAYLAEGGRPELMRFERDLPYAPSLFYLPAGQEERALWGAAAEEMLQDDPSGVVEVLKRKLHEAFVRAGRRGERKETPRRLLAALLADLRRQAGEQVPALGGHAPARASLTLPALAGPVEERLLREAASEAGFVEVELVTEPVAAARAWLMQTGERADEVCVLDCGGGTIDWAYLRRDGSDFRIVPECPPGGDRHVGGHDVDVELLSQVAEALPPEAQDALWEREPYYLAQVRAVKERAGRGLPIPPLQVGGHTVQLTKAQIQDVGSARFIEQACTGLADYLERVKALTSGQVPPVLLVGGSAWLIGLKETLEQRLTCRVLRWERSDYAVALGALNNGAAPSVSARSRASLSIQQQTNEQDEDLASIQPTVQGARTTANWEDTATFKYLLLTFDTDRGFWYPIARDFCSILPADLLEAGMLVFTPDRHIIRGHTASTGIDYLDCMADEWCLSEQELPGATQSSYSTADLKRLIEFSTRNTVERRRWSDALWERFQSHCGLKVVGKAGFILRHKVFSFSDHKWLERRSKVIEKLMNFQPRADCTADALLLSGLFGRGGEFGCKVPLKAPERVALHKCLSACTECLPIVKDYHDIIVQREIEEYARLHV